MRRSSNVERLRWLIDYCHRNQWKVQPDQAIVEPRESVRLAAELRYAMRRAWTTYLFNSTLPSVWT